MEATMGKHEERVREALVWHRGVLLELPFHSGYSLDIAHKRLAASREWLRHATLRE
jgi:hypothetical protein